MKGPLLPTCQLGSSLQSLLYVLGEREIQERGRRKGERKKEKVRKERKKWWGEDEKWRWGANLYRT